MFKDKSNGYISLMRNGTNNNQNLGGCMKLVKQSVEIVNKQEYEPAIRLLEQAGRTCYQSKTSETLAGAEKYLQNLIKAGHESVIEHLSVTVKFVTNRNITHQIVRHRIGSQSQMSTRYVLQTKGDELEVINPFGDDTESVGFQAFKKSVELAGDTYKYLIENGVHKDIARDVLPGSIKTELVTTFNIRGWRHFFKLRCDKHSHPQIVELAKMALEQMYEAYPCLFEDLYREFILEQ